VLGLAECEIEVTARPDGAVEFDPEQMWQSVLAAAHQALAAAGRPALAAIGLGNQGETIVAWNRKTGSPVGPAIVWQDRRATAVCDEIARRSDAEVERLAQLTGLTLDPYFVAPKMVWLERQLRAAGQFTLDLAITTTDTWLLHRLCGAFVTDIATAGRSLLLGLDTGSWSAEAASTFGIDISTLPRVVGNTTTLGECTLFGGVVPVTGACVDQQAALFAERCRTRGEAKCTYGTGAFMLACTGTTPARSTNGLVGCPAWQLDGQTTYCLDGQVYTVGAAVSWLIDMGIMREPADLDLLGGSVTDSGGATFVPALAGLAAPWWQPTAKAMFAGLSLGTERAHLVRATIDGIAAQVALLAAAAGTDLDAPLQLLRVDGGLTRSQTLLQVQADLLQCPVEVYPSPHATALGVAEFALIGSGAAGTFDTFGGSAIRAVEPLISADEANERLTAWQAVANLALSASGTAR
jgi:glycerol kinase